VWLGSAPGNRVFWPDLAQLLTEWQKIRQEALDDFIYLQEIKHSAEEAIERSQARLAVYTRSTGKLAHFLY